jgi:hypothetical protein
MDHHETNSGQIHLRLADTKPTEIAAYKANLGVSGVPRLSKTKRFSAKMMGTRTTPLPNRKTKTATTGFTILPLSGILPHSSMECAVFILVVK